MSHQQELALFDSERSTICLNYFNQLRRRDKFLDLTIISKENLSIQAHRLVICAQFPSIENKLNYDDSERIEWKRFPLRVIESVIEFAYTGGIRINLLNVVQLYLLSQNLGCARLIAWCVDFMKSRIESLDLNEIWSVANVTANKELQGVCVRLVADNLWLHCRNKRFFTHTELDGLRALLADNEIRTMDVTSKLIAISSWMAASDFANERAERESEFENLLEDIDLSGLPRTFFTDLATKNIDMDLSDVCRKILLKKYKEMEERGKSATRTLSAHERQPPVPSSVPLDAQILYAYGDDIDSYRGILKTVPGMQGGRDYQFFVPRRDNVAVLVFNDDIFLIGGKTQTNVSVSQVDKVDTRSGNITSVQPMSCRRNGASAVVSGQSIIVFGGCDSTRNTTLSSCEEYDPSSDRWKSVPDMSIGRYGSGAAHIPGLGELVVGGYSRTDFNEGLSVAELLSSGDGNWRTIAPMLCSRRFPKVTYFNQSVIVAGDLNNHFHTVERLTLTEGLAPQWSMLCTGFLLPSSLSSICVFRGKLHVSFGNAKIFEVKDLLSECKWELICRMEGISWIKLLVVNS